jgi:glycerol-3-phosphate acyltransferase PlsY
MDPVRDTLLVVFGYLSGSLPMGVIVARLTGGRDPRTVGSGRTGGTNALRAMGWGRGLLIGFLDVGKGALPVLVARFAGAPDLVLAFVGVAAVLGAWRSIFLRFHGGRGVAAGVGAMAAIQPLVIPLAAPVFFGVIALSRYVALGSIVGSAATVALLALLVATGASGPAPLVFGVLAGGVIILAHADSIGRLMRGEEPGFTFSREGT